MKKLVTWAAVVTLVVAAIGGQFKPSETFRTFVSQVFSGQNSPTETASTRVQKFAGQLQKNLQSFGAMREKVQLQLAEQVRIQRERDHELLGVQALLARFKDEYAVGAGPGGFPRQVLGRTYSKEAIEEQVQLLLTRRAELEQKSSHDVAENEKLQRSLSDLDQRIGMTKTHLDSMPTYLTLMESRELTGQSDKTIDELEACLDANEALLGSTVRDSKELLQALRGEQLLISKQLSALDYLKSCPQSPKEVAASATKPESVVTPVAAQTPATPEKSPCPTPPQELPASIKSLIGSLPTATTE